MIADRTSPQEWETFTLVDPFNQHSHNQIWPGAQIALRTFHGRFVCAEQDNRLVGDRTQVGEWERFTVSSAGGFQPTSQPSYPQQTSFMNVTVHSTMGPTLNFGDRIKLKHIATGNVLHSHQLTYYGGSRQQQVTCYNFRDDNDWWEIQAPFGGYGPVQYGATIILRHVTTGLYLHSHFGHQSPATQQQEVTCYGGRDQNDNWVLSSVHNQQGYVSGGAQILLTHVQTNKRLHSHANKYNLGNGDEQQEVTCYEFRDRNDEWSITEIANKYRE
jgi:dolichyl-phosphate-mannose--protein O-mannosyl transferase